MHLRRVLIAVSMALITLPASAQFAQQLNSDDPANQRDGNMVTAILLALSNITPNDEKGWFLGHPRSFSSGYGNTSDQLKADWACDLNQFISNSGEKIGQLTPDGRIAGFVPYSRRDKFAEFWWLRHCPDYKGSWSKDSWKHEAIMDATELAWRATRPGGAAGAAQHAGEMELLRDQAETQH